jgi:hypothetical protein
MEKVPMELSPLTIARSTKSQFSAFGMDFSHEGKSGFSSRFSWAA